MHRRDYLKTQLLGTGFLPARPASSTPANAPAIPLIAFRIGVPLWGTDERFQALLDFFRLEPGTADELAFFTSATHPPLEAGEMQRRAERLAGILPRVRAQGMSAGINVLATMGHHEENLPHSLNAPWQRIVGPTGAACLGTYCPAQPELLNYAREIYTLMAQAGPDFIWVDDDVRLQGHRPVSFGCFCDLCMREFSKESGREFTRETLVRAFSAGDLDLRLALRRQWLDHNAAVIDRLLAAVEQAVHKVKPGLPLGFMTGDRFYEGYAFSRWAATLSGPGKSPVRWRPGGGFYSDEVLGGLIDKANAIGRQVAALTPGVRVIQSELENFPYQRLRKSARTTVVEAAAHMAAGATGTAFNVLTMYKDPLDEYVPLYRRIAGSRKLYAALQSALGRGRALGVWPAWNRYSFATVNTDGDWLAPGKMSLSEPYILQEIGIPVCYERSGSVVTALSGAAVFAFTRDELRDILRGGVLLDAEAWRALDRLGLADLTGIRGLQPVDRDATEVLSSHPINGRYAGWSRDCRQSFWWERAWRLEPSGDAAGILARMVDYADADLGPVMYAGTNKLGGRVAVMGYYPWTQIHSLAKSSQMKALCAWLSRERMPATLESFARIVLWCREREDGKRAYIFLNASLDPAPAVVLLLNSEAAAFIHVTESGERREIAGSRAKGGVRVEIRDLAPWSVHLIAER